MGAVSGVTGGALTGLCVHPSDITLLSDLGSISHCVMGALSFSPKGKLGDGQTFLWGPYSPLTSAILPAWGPGGSPPNSPLPSL